MSYKLNPFTGKLDNTGTEPVVPASIDDLNDVDTSTVAPTDGQGLVWDNANSQWKPGSSGASLPTATTDGKALIVENGQWVEGPVIGGVNYTTGQTPTSTYTVPTGYTIVTDTWQIFPAGDPDVTLSNNDLTATVTSNGTQSVASSTARSSGKWYWEVSIDTVSVDTFVGIRSSTTGNYPGASNSDGLSVRSGGQAYNDGVGTSNNGNNKGGYASGDILMWALDLDNGEIYMGKNGTWFGTSDPSTGTDSWFNNIVPGSYYFTCYASVATEEYTQNTVMSPGSTTVIPYSIDKLEDVDISTAAPTNGQALLWDNADSKFKPGTVSGGTSLPTANDGEALIYANSQWVAGPVIGGYNYAVGNSSSSVYTIPTGFSPWSAEFNTADTVTSPTSEITLSNSNRTATANVQGTWKNAISTSPKSTGKWYWEIKVLNNNSQGNEFSGVFTNINAPYAGHSTSGGMAFRSNASTHYNYAGATKDFSGSYSGYTTNDILMFAIDLDNKKFWYGKNGTWDNSGDPAAGTGQMYSNWTGTPSFYFTHSLHENGDSVELVGYLVPGTTYQAPAIAKRKTSSVTTSSLATNASADVTLPLTGKAGQFVSVTVDYPAWVVFYTDAAARTADASRAQTTDALPGSGVLLEVATSTAGETVVVTPSSGYFNNESTPVSELSIKVVNLDSVARAITVDANVIPLEV